MSISVKKDVFEKTNIGDYVWQVYMEGGMPKVGKVFVKGKKLQKDDVFILQLSNSFRGEVATYFEENKAIEILKLNLVSRKKRLEKLVAETSELIEGADEYFKLKAEESLDESTRNSSGSFMSMIGMFDEGDKDFKITPDLIPDLEFEVGEKVFTVYTPYDTDMYGKKNGEWTIVEDMITELEVYFRSKDDIDPMFSTLYGSSSSGRRRGNMFKTKEEAETYCREYADKLLKGITDKIDNIDYKSCVKEGDEVELPSDNGFGDIF